MTGFLVTSIELELLEKIITKLEWKSYFRMQQTCKQMEEMIRTNKKIKGIRMDATAYFEGIEMDSYQIDDLDDADNETIYGVCWKEFDLEISGDGDDDDDDDSDAEWRMNEFEFLDLLEKHRITCRKLLFRHRSSRKLNLEQFKRMLKVLQPEIINRDICDEDFYPSYNALFDANSLKEVEIGIEFESQQKFRHHIFRLVSHFRKVRLEYVFEELSQGEIFNLISNVLQYIHSQPLPQFQSLVFGFSSHQDVAGLSSTDYLHGLLRNYDSETKAVPNLTNTEYQIEIGNYNYKGHTDVEFSTAVFDLKEMNMSCRIERKRLHYLKNNTITGCNVTVNIHRM